MDRSWANGMTQEDFVHEFIRRNPSADAIPTVEEYAKSSEPVYHGIDPFSPDALLIEEKPPEPKDFPCGKCGSVFEHKIARFQHERKCFKQ